MNFSMHSTAEVANVAAADSLAGWLTAPTTRTVMVAAGNTPIVLYRRISERGLKLSHLSVFALDEYVGVPPDEPRNCANLLRRCVQQAWGIPSAQFHTVSSLEAEAQASVLEHERKITRAGGLDVIILGLGQNGHLGFNEPGSAEDSVGRLLDLEKVSIEANRKWFGGDYAPPEGVTVGLRTILAARHVLLLACGSHKAAAVKAMVEGPRGLHCPASLLQGHPDTRLFLDEAAAALLTNRIDSAEMPTEANEGNEANP
jgi:glucosamine-6-phosphate deaminase